MNDRSGDRAEYFPRIETKHGKPIAHWQRELKKLGAVPYAEQMKFLQEEHGFSRTHANALVMHERGSTTSRRHATVDEYLATLSPEARATVLDIFTVITKKHRRLEMVMAWNQPMLRIGKDYVFALSVSTKHLTINPWSTDVLTAHAEQLADLVVKKHTFQVPIGWKVDRALILSLVGARLAELS